VVQVSQLAAQATQFPEEIKYPVAQVVQVSEAEQTAQLDPQATQLPETLA